LSSSANGKKKQASIAFSSPVDMLMVVSDNLLDQA